MVRYFAFVLALLAPLGYASQDPTAPLGWEKPNSTQPSAKKKVVYRLPTLNSIVCVKRDSCYATLNNTVVESGDRVNGYQVTRITDEVVTVARDSKQWNLELFSLDIKN
ncbi:MSHA biogenesis protein MshK [Vibrio sp. SCSIO 43135]|uniref:MSHA biogenesis protein MshK n=1 Tax=Vibrio sp. SCSIO 43135 TaxID=2819096 RepID=UPI00207506E4|nr:MSHA biogenesis protein MshK [Vibrio sp. SCSIO 43135]USD41492.1 MSHA biogenesis protein MshK [Vibrio sp. SCSIO 43135]